VAAASTTAVASSTSAKAADSETESETSSQNAQNRKVASKKDEKDEKSQLAKSVRVKRGSSFRSMSSRPVNPRKESANGYEFCGVAFALSHATLEGKITIAVLLLFSLVSWTVIINKFRQLAKAKKRNAIFSRLYSKAKSPLVIFSKGPITQLRGPHV